MSNISNNQNPIHHIEQTSVSHVDENISSENTSLGAMVDDTVSKINDLYAQIDMTSLFSAEELAENQAIQDYYDNTQTLSPEVLEKIKNAMVDEDLVIEEEIIVEEENSIDEPIKPEDNPMFAMLDMSEILQSEQTHVEETPIAGETTLPSRKMVLTEKNQVLLLNTENDLPQQEVTKDHQYRNDDLAITALLQEMQSLSELQEELHLKMIDQNISDMINMQIEEKIQNSPLEQDLQEMDSSFESVMQSLNENLQEEEELKDDELQEAIIDLKLLYDTEQIERLLLEQNNNVEPMLFSYTEALDTTKIFVTKKHIEFDQFLMDKYQNIVQGIIGSECEVVEPMGIFSSGKTFTYDNTMQNNLFFCDKAIQLEVGESLLLPLKHFNVQDRSDTIAEPSLFSGAVIITKTDLKEFSLSAIGAGHENMSPVFQKKMKELKQLFQSSAFAEHAQHLLHTNDVEAAPSMKMQSTPFSVSKSSTLFKKSKSKGSVVTMITILDMLKKDFKPSSGMGKAPTTGNQSFKSDMIGKGGKPSGGTSNRFKKRLSLMMKGRFKFPKQQNNFFKMKKKACKALVMNKLMKIQASIHRMPSVARRS